MRPLARPWVRFGVVGVSNALISYLALWLALAAFAQTRRRVLLAQAISYIAGLLWSFFWNRRWAFSASDGGARQLASFVALQLALLLATALALEWLVTSAGWVIYAAWLAVMIPATILNFLAQRAWVFAAAGRS